MTDVFVCVPACVYMYTRVYVQMCAGACINTHTHAVSEVHTDQDRSVYYFKGFLSAKSPDTICASTTQKEHLTHQHWLRVGVSRKY